MKHEIMHYSNIVNCYHPQRSWGKVIFLHLFVILFTGGACVVAPGGCVWLLLGGVCMVAPGGCAWLLRGVCMVALGGCAWLLPGGCAWLLPGGCVWLLWGGGMCGCSGGHAWLLYGGVWLLWGECAWLLWGGMRGIRRDTEIRSMSGWYASYWNAFLLKYMY